ncbi:40S ribosomal protein S15 [Hibiscus syriacus]|uniref:40S ribosomal protein S15 n=1 Tax=Hibiscus syriacus TaxID=106335 RepID=A0A6A3A4Q5_HIBSY|nr:40S ribosomal protein S15 [Hibiscus syriacus]
MIVFSSGDVREFWHYRAPCSMDDPYCEGYHVRFIFYGKATWCFQIGPIGSCSSFCHVKMKILLYGDLYLGWVISIPLDIRHRGSQGCRGYTGKVGVVQRCSDVLMRLGHYVVVEISFSVVMIFLCGGSQRYQVTSLLREAEVFFLNVLTEVSVVKQRFLVQGSVIFKCEGIRLYIQNSGHFLWDVYADVDADIAVPGVPKKRTFKKFSLRGVDLDALLDMSTDELVKLFPARRRFQRGLKRKPMALKREAPPGEKPEPVRTHLRNMIIVPEMIGSIIGIYNGKTFNKVEIKPEMISYCLAKFSISYKLVKHGRPGIGATHSSRFIPLK